LNSAILFPERFTTSRSVNLSRDVPMVVIWLPARLRSLSFVRVSIPWRRGDHLEEGGRGRREERGVADTH